MCLPNMFVMVCEYLQSTLPEAADFNFIHEGSHSKFYWLNFNKFYSNEIQIHAKIMKLVETKFTILNTKMVDRYGVWPLSVFAQCLALYTKNHFDKIYFDVFAPSSSPSLIYDCIVVQAICYQALLIWLRRWTSDI